MKLRNSLIMVLILVLLVTCLPMGVFAEADQTMTKNGDVVLVMDDTGSMKRNDPNKAAETAIKHFGAYTPVNTSNLGVVTFGSKVMAKYGMVKVTDKTQAELADFAARNITRSAQKTDLVVGLKEAVNMLTGLPESDNVQAIIAVTDGGNDYGEGRTEELSNTELAQLEQTCKEKGIKIYLIGLNLNETSVSAYLNGIAGVTGGDVKFVKTGEELKNAIVEYYQELGILQEDDKKDLEIPEGGVDEPHNIPENVFEAIFTIDHESPIELTVTGPDGNQLSDSACSITSSDTSTVMKLREPAPGKYILHFKNVNGGKQMAQMTTYLNSELGVEVTAPAAVEPNQDFTVKAALKRGGQQYLNEDLLNLKAMAKLTNGNNEVEQELTLQGDQFEGTVQVPSEGDWTVSVTITSGKGFNRTNDSEVIVKAAKAAAPSQTTPAPKKEVNPIIFVIIGIVVLLIAAAVVVFLWYSKLPKLSDVPMGSLRVSCSNARQQLWTVSLSGRRVFGNMKARTKGYNLYTAIMDQSKNNTTPLNMSNDQKACCQGIELRLQKRQGRGGGAYQIVMVDNGATKPNLNQHINLNDIDGTYISTEWR